MKCQNISSQMAFFLADGQHDNKDILWRPKGRNGLTHFKLWPPPSFGKYSLSNVLALWEAESRGRIWYCILYWYSERCWYTPFCNSLRIFLASSIIRFLPASFPSSLPPLSWFVFDAFYLLRHTPYVTPFSFSRRGSLVPFPRARFLASNGQR